VTGFDPTLRLIVPEYVPDAIAVPFTLTVEVDAETVGLRLMPVAVYGTSTVYDVVLTENEGVRVPAETERPARLAFVFTGSLVITIV
jgi:hypothetical protein